MADETATTEQATPENKILEAAYLALIEQGNKHQVYKAYYDGDAPTKYTNSRLQEIFKGLDAYFAQNWCAVIVDSSADRIELKSLTTKNASAATRLTEMWSEQQLDLESADIILDTLITGEGFAMAWLEEDETASEDEESETQDAEKKLAEFYRNDPCYIHVEYESNNPRKMAWAAKWFDLDDGRKKLVIYFADRIDYYVSSGKANQIQSYKNFQPDDPATAPNPYGRIPVFHFRLSGRGIKSELKNAIPIQDSINKLLADMMIAGEFGAFKQRYVISQAESLGNLKNAPNEIWNIPAGDGMGQQTQVGEFSAADLAQYYGTIDKLAASLSSITRTPKHFFFSQAGELSGEALMTLEAPLVKKATKYIARLLPTFRELAAFMLQIEGISIEAKEIEPTFADPRSVQPVTQAEVRKASKEAGIPLKTLLRDEGKSEEWMTQMDKDKAEEKQETQDTLAQALANRQRQFDQNGNQE